MVSCQQGELSAGSIFKQKVRLQQCATLAGKRRIELPFGPKVALRQPCHDLLRQGLAFIQRHKRTFGVDPVEVPQQWFSGFQDFEFKALHIDLEKIARTHPQLQKG